eukprot:6214741-Pleurochrysis_carterae.AAC.4
MATTVLAAFTTPTRDARHLTYYTHNNDVQKSKIVNMYMTVICILLLTSFSCDANQRPACKGAVPCAAIWVTPSASLQKTKQTVIKRAPAEERAKIVTAQAPALT